MCKNNNSMNQFMSNQSLTCPPISLFSLFFNGYFLWSVHVVREGPTARSSCSQDSSLHPTKTSLGRFHQILFVPTFTWWMIQDFESTLQFQKRCNFKSDGVTLDYFIKSPSSYIYIFLFNKKEGGNPSFPLLFPFSWALISLQ